MTAAQILEDFHAQGVGIRLEGGLVKVTAPTGAVTADQASILRANKAEIVAFLEAANDQPAEVGIPATVEPRSDGYQPFDYGPADQWTMKYRRNPLKSPDEEAAKDVSQMPV
jgi:hypothetical protein